MSNISELKISSNKIDWIEDFSLRGEMVGKLTLHGNHILAVPSQRALKNMQVKQVSLPHHNSRLRQT